MNIVPYDFTEARAGPCFKGYWVKLYCFFDGVRVYHFAHEHDLIDNVQLAHECGINTNVFVHNVLVSKDSFKDIFDDIQRYVSSTHSH